MTADNRDRDKDVSMTAEKARAILSAPCGPNATGANPVRETLDRATARGYLARVEEERGWESKYEALGAAMKAREAEYNRANKDLVKLHQQLQAKEKENQCLRSLAIACTEKPMPEWSAKIWEMDQEIASLRSAQKALVEALEEYGEHQSKCVLAYWQCGEPTPEGGYRQMFAGKWYEVRPVDRTPPCTCGLTESLAAHKQEKV